ncbi:uncharacterized protein (DUF305 family) [Neomicrococcus aestuarii]|uniref:Uncharacterized protein (DUF305 family) n=1 Tax=Neomicrococcus aestuarii TaxID=556325 RepID=A0A7W8X0X3_9MICC|nr:DUF305 domain-containing protein [Neomicrococcus aestuarii]MBB5512149.1 uncharacterized protein (DUF305 family) [Neomicrococcus aestuarii]
MSLPSAAQPYVPERVILPLRAGYLWFGFVTVVVLTALVFFAIGWSSATPRPVSDTGADAGFARDMQAHHAQAVEMALLIRDKSSNEEIRAVAYDVATSQQHQKGQMYAWLQNWGLPQARSIAPMAWMESEAGGHGSGSAHAGQNGAGGAESAMEGMATPEQMQALRGSSGVEADRLFTDLMIRHHQGGVAMASAGVRLAETSTVREFAALIVDAQTAEITALQELRSRL